MAVPVKVHMSSPIKNESIFVFLIQGYKWTRICNGFGGPKVQCDSRFVNLSGESPQGLHSGQIHLKENGKSGEMILLSTPKQVPRIKTKSLITDALLASMCNVVCSRIWI